ncbi:MAG: hypothetical protein ACKOAI_04810, partial [Acidimicrobiia bacterium]
MALVVPRAASPMNPIFRLTLEMRVVWAMSSPRLATHYTKTVLQQLLAVRRAKTLAPVDAAMLGVQCLTVNRQRLVLPLGEIAELLRGRDDTPTFAMAREMYGANVYLRAFRPDFRMGTVIDLGANRGMFQLLATCGYGARIAIGVEPNALYDPVLRLLRESNGLRAERVPRHRALASGTCGEGKITLAELMDIYALKEVDFLKCDIEGGEFDVVVGNM